MTAGWGTAGIGPAPTCPEMVPPTSLADGQWFTVDGGASWHMCAVNMASMGTVAAYVSGRRSSNGLTYRVDVSDHPLVGVRANNSPPTTRLA